MPKGAKDFVNEVKNNADLRKKLYKQSGHVVRELAKEHGYEFTDQELHDAIREKVSAPLSPAAETGADFCVVVIVVAVARSK
jgi:predicted ribosomally synthesized peptide with nif11-like leader